MRNMSFRGKCVDDNDWVNGYYTELPVGSLGATIFANTDEVITEDTDSFIIAITTRQYSSLSPANPLEVVESELIKVIPETIGQFTGLLDKNGNKIFEDDIIKTKFYGKDTGNGVNFNDYDYFRVVYHEASFCIENATRRFVITSESAKRFEIIGNIYDNPELLKENN